MGIEIERKFLPADDSWRQGVERSERMRQGYLSRTDTTAIRVRIAGSSAKLNVKHTLEGIHRLEFEYDIPLEDANEMLDEVALRPIIDKTRHYLYVGDHLWEVDEFHAENEGLIVAEIELDHADAVFERPSWIGKEVSTDKRYFNSNLSAKPFSEW